MRHRVSDTQAESGHLLKIRRSWCISVSSNWQSEIVMCNQQCFVVSTQIFPGVSNLLQRRNNLSLFWVFFFQTLLPVCNCSASTTQLFFSYLPVFSIQEDNVENHDSHCQLSTVRRRFQCLHVLFSQFLRQISRPIWSDILPFCLWFIKQYLFYLTS